ncbi:MAG TPA: hypothetical protein VJI33_02745 [Candidatus Paceibacterota bacterium]
MNGRLKTDILIILASIIFATVLVKFHVIELVIGKTESNILIGSFVSGLFFTSIFTTAPAIVALGEISKLNNIFLVAILGGLGAMVGDYIIFRFFRNRLGDDILQLIRGRKKHWWKHLFKSHLGKRILAVLGALIIASPLPDELGLMLMGVSKLKNSTFLPLSFLMNSLGILIIALVANNF